ncbi:MAG TPA: protein kinase, partial [Acidimicrobiales bacterium]
MAGESGVPAIPDCRSLSLLGERPGSTLYAADSDRFGGAVTVTVYTQPADDRTRERFEAAVATARRLGAHPNLVTVHARGYTGDGRPYVVIDGHERTTLEGVLATGGVQGVEAVLAVGIALAGALETAHRADVVHGGVAPGLVLLRDDGQPILTETGLVELGQPVGASAALARRVPYHAPPEVLEGTSLSPATDVYSLAAVVYTMLVGSPPHASTDVDDSTASLLLRILQMPLRAIDRTDVPPGVEEALRSALAHSPQKRPQRAVELAWTFQDAQRAAGLEVTEPVVLDPLGAGGAPEPEAPASPPPIALPPPSVGDPVAQPTGSASSSGSAGAG